MSYTQCPNCLTLFRVEVRHLRQAGGVVRCGLCGEPFNALASLCDSLPGDLPPQDPGTSGAAPEPDSAESVGWSAPERAAPAAAPPDAPASAPRPAPAGPPPPDWERTTRLEVEAAPAPPPRRGRRVALWLLLVLLLAAGAAGTAAWPERERLLQDPRWRPWLAEACAVAGCELPLLRRPQAVRVIERELAAVPGREDTLRFTATVVNRAGEPLAWPELRLQLLDAAGRAVATHRLPAARYLAEPVPGRGMPAGERVRLALEIPDPGPGAASFEIAFR